MVRFLCDVRSKRYFVVRCNLCLLDWCMQVVGAGRGPLVQASLNAGVTAGRALKVYAVEKNANAVITLRNRAIMDGWDTVTIVSKDMRQWVSERRH